MMISGVVNSIDYRAPLLWRSIRIKSFTEFVPGPVKLCPSKCISKGSLFTNVLRKLPPVTSLLMNCVLVSTCDALASPH